MSKPIGVTSAWRSGPYLALNCCAISWPLSDMPWADMIATFSVTAALAGAGATVAARVAASAASENHAGFPTSNHPVNHLTQGYSSVSRTVSVLHPVRVTGALAREPLVVATTCAVQTSSAPARARPRCRPAVADPRPGHVV